MSLLPPFLDSKLCESLQPTHTLANCRHWDTHIISEQLKNMSISLDMKKNPSAKSNTFSGPGVSFIFVSQDQK